MGEARLCFARDTHAQYRVQFHPFEKKEKVHNFTIGADMSHDDLLNRLNEVPALAGNEQQNATTLGELRAIKKLEVDRNLTKLHLVLPFACASQHAD